MADAQIAVIAVDWGTSHLRLWPIDRYGNAMAVHRSGDGMRTVKDRQFAAILERHLNDMDADHETPIIMCGMVGSRQGWQEAPYVSLPCHVQDAARGAVKIINTDRDIRILPGIANRDASMADVMRSEETQLLGLSDLSQNPLSGLVCMPGTHAKWVMVENDRVTDFATSLSGELFAALASGSVLQHAMQNADGKIDPAGDAFLNAIKASLDHPATILNRLFSVRPKSLLHDLSDNDAAAHISGTIIGQDIAGAIARFKPDQSVILVGSGHLGDLYGAAIKLAGLKIDIVDGDDLAVSGLRHAAKLIWPDRFKP